MHKKHNIDKVTFFQALGDTTRLRLLNLMGKKEICVCYLVEILALPQPKISRHLAYLRRAGIVTARREGKWMHYRIVHPEDSSANAMLRHTLDWLKEDAAMQEDRARLSIALLELTQIAVPSGAPLPTPLKKSHSKEH